MIGEDKHEEVVEEEGVDNEAQPKKRRRPRRSRVYRMTDYEFMAVLKEFWARTEPDFQFVMPNLIKMLKAEFDKDNKKGVYPLTSENVKQKYRAVSAAARRYAKKSGKEDYVFSLELPPEINWDDWLIKKTERTQKED